MRDVGELIGKFRTSEYFYDVFWHEVRRKLLLPKLTKELPYMSEEEFKELLSNRDLFGDIKIPNINKMLENFKETKLRLMNLFLRNEPIEKRIKEALEIKGMSIYTISNLLSATSDEFILYHDNLVSAIWDLLPELQKKVRICTELLPKSEVSTAEEYVNFNEFCKILRDILGFRSLGELHEFLWHGYNTNWTFQKIPNLSS